MTLQDVLRWTGGVARPSVPESFGGVCTDTRNLARGCLFVALRGARFDGHAFAADAVRGGAGAVLADAAAALPPDVPAVLVPDTAAALRAMAAGWRDKVAPRVLGVTGSAGKTTTKELAAHLIAAAGPVAKTIGNFNNDVGLPLSILAMPEGSKFGVFEAGTNHPGEMAPLAFLMKPDAAILTNVGPVHIGNFGSEERIADEKAALLRAVPPGGFCFLDADGAHFGRLGAACEGRRIVTVSVSGRDGADYAVVRADAATGAFTVVERDGGAVAELRSPRPGTHQMLDALLAVAAARCFAGVAWEDISGRLATSPNAGMRWEISEEGGVRWTNDAYNANPISMKAAIEAFCAAESKAARRILVLGDMGELGLDREEALHRGVGAVVAQLAPDALVCVGPKARWIADEAVRRGFPASRAASSVPGAAEAREFLRGFLKPGDSVLLKASRSVALENARFRV